MLKLYKDNQEEKEVKKEFEGSGVACDEKNCKGEMMVELPIKKHPEFKELRRAFCGKCNWQGWV